jgi:hypothetical protein
MGKSKEIGGIVGSERPDSIIVSNSGAASITKMNSENTASTNYQSETMIAETESAEKIAISPGIGLTQSNIKINATKEASSVSSIIKTTTSLSTSSNTTTMSTTTRPPCLEHECKLNVMYS